MNKKIKFVLGLPKSILYNLRLFDLRTALKLPILFAPNSRIIGGEKFSIKIIGRPKFGMLSVGFWDGSDYLGENNTSTIEIEKNGRLELSGKVSFASGTHVLIGEGALLSIGKEFKGNANLHIVCRNKIRIGNDVLVSWNCTMLDNDGHTIVKAGRVLNESEEINIDDHVWIGSDVNIMKGCFIPVGSIIASRSVLAKQLCDEKSIYVNVVNTRVLKEKVEWIL